MGAASGALAGGQSIKSIQRGGTVLSGATLTVNPAITAVNMDKSILTHLGVRSNSASVNESMTELQFASSTTLYVLKFSGGATAYMSWQVVEYN